jgi:hypothetical protein
MLAIIRRLRVGNIHEELVGSVQVALCERNSHWQRGVAMEFGAPLPMGWQLLSTFMNDVTL